MSKMSEPSQEVKEWLKSLPTGDDKATNQDENYGSLAVCYVRTSTLRIIGDRVHGCFSPNKYEACSNERDGNPIDRWRVQQTRSAGACNNSREDVTEITFVWS